MMKEHILQVLLSLKKFFHIPKALFSCAKMKKKKMFGLIFSKKIIQIQQTKKRIS